MSLISYARRPWLVEPTAFQRHIDLALARPCPTTADMEAAKAKAMALADNAPTAMAYAIEGRGIDLPDMHAEAPRAIRAVKGKIAILPAYGPLDQRMSEALEKSGGTSIEFLSRAFDRLMNDSSVGAVVFDWDCPGGGVAGTQEFADRVYNARGTKPTYSICNSLMASAAYWIGTAADMVICTPGGLVGSVGVYTMHLDRSEQTKQEGVAVTMIQAGRFKTELAPFGPLSEDAKSYLQKGVDSTYTAFTEALKRNRGVSIETVRKDFGEGRVLDADDALRAKMIDRILSMEQLLQKLVGASDSPTRAQHAEANADVLRKRQAHRERQWKATLPASA